MTSKPEKAVFLDRDGTLNVDPGYLRDPEQLVLLDHVGKALFLLREAGFLLIVVSNQSGVARGLIDKDALPLIHARMNELLVPEKVILPYFELCLHHPSEKCHCRKPRPDLLLQAAERLGIDLTKSYMVGDKRSDLEAGKSAGCRGSCLVRTGYGAHTEREISFDAPSFIGETLLDVAHWILKDSQSE